MSDFQVLIPDVGEAKDVEVVEICVVVGQTVALDDALIVIESDKASMEVPAPATGTVKSIDVKIGDIIDTGDLVVVLDSEESAPQEVVADTSEESSAGDAANRQEHADNNVSSVETPLPNNDGIGATFEIRLPELGDVDDVEVVELLVKVGDQVTPKDALVVLESDKATMELPSTVTGVVEMLAVKVGDKVTDESLIAVIRTESESAGDQSVSPVVTVDKDEKPTAESSDSSPVSQTVDTTKETLRDRAAVVYAGPAVRRLARELGVDLARVEGSGVRGRIVKDDVKQFVKQQLGQPPVVAESGGLPKVEYPDFSRFGDTEEQPLTRIQERGANNLVKSWLNVVHVTQHDEADVTELEEFRTELNERELAEGQRLTALPFVLKACAATLREHPRFNASISPTLKTLILKKYIHIGVAVDTADGLVVPVVRDVLDKGLRDIAAEVEALSELARTKKLAPDQISGASFTVSSLGRLGGTGFTPIVNAPEVAILGVAKLAKKPVWVDSAFEPRVMLPLSLSYDHRAINGAEAGRFMQSLVEKLGDVRRLIL